MVRSHAEWEVLIREAYASELPFERWCLENDIKLTTFHKAKSKLLRLGKLRFLEDKVPLFISKNDKWTRLPAEDFQAFLVLEPIRGNISIDSMASIIWFDLNLPLIEGNVFFFIAKNRKQIYALRVCKNGYCLFTRKLDYGTFFWPKSHCYERNFMYKYEYDNLLKTIEI